MRTAEHHMDRLKMIARGLVGYSNDHAAAAFALAEIDRLKSAIREHRDQKGDDRCWLDDGKLYAALGEGDIDLYATALPPKCDFLVSCERYWKERQQPLEHGTNKLPEGMTIQQLTKEVERLDSLVVELSKPRPHVVETAVDHFGHVRCVSCGHAFDSHEDTCFNHERLIREGKVAAEKEGGKSC